MHLTTPWHYLNVAIYKDDVNMVEHLCRRRATKFAFRLIHCIHLVEFSAHVHRDSLYTPSAWRRRGGRVSSESYETALTYVQGVAHMHAVSTKNVPKVSTTLAKRQMRESRSLSTLSV